MRAQAGWMRLACVVGLGAAGLGLGGVGCASQSAAPATMLDLRALPDEPLRRNERIESTQARPGPEGRKSLTPRARQIETGVATAAALLGMLLSKNPTVLLGAGAPMDENRLVGDDSAERASGRDDGGDDEGDRDGDRDRDAKKKRGRREGKGEDDARDVPVDASQLVPWVKLRDPDAPQQ